MTLKTPAITPIAAATPIAPPPIFVLPAPLLLVELAAAAVADEKRDVPSPSKLDTRPSLLVELEVIVGELDVDIIDDDGKVDTEMMVVTLAELEGVAGEDACASTPDPDAKTRRAIAVSLLVTSMFSY